MPKLNFILLLAAVIIESYSCGGKRTQNGKETGDYLMPPVDTVGAVVGDWIIQRELADPQSLNPITLQDATGREFSYHIFERLMWAADRTSYDLVPWLA